MSPRASRWQAYPPAGKAGHTVVGTLRVARGVESPQLGNRRDLFVLLPPSYARASKRRYPVLYMHDAQNLFDEATSFAGEWRVDETMKTLAAEDVEAIVVGIPNTGKTRCDEYSPFADPKHGGGCGDEYLAFLLETVKPLVDRDFRTRPEREHTGLLGSSMGGLISLYGFFRHPAVFGFAGAMSPSLWFAGGAVFPFVEQAPFTPGRLYLDVGTREGERTVLDARRMRNLLHEKGYDAEHDLRYVEEKGAGHSEAAWARRLAEALRFLLAG